MSLKLHHVMLMKPLLKLRLKLILLCLKTIELGRWVIYVAKVYMYFCALKFENLFLTTLYFNIFNISETKDISFI